MNLPFFRLEAPLELHDYAEVVSEPHERAADAITHRIAVPEGAVLVTSWHGSCHEVIYQTPLDDDIAQASRNAQLFEAYGDGHEWIEVLDNGFGKTYRRSDESRFSLWSYTMDFNTFGTMEFHGIRWG